MLVLVQREEAITRPIDNRRAGGHFKGSPELNRSQVTLHTLVADPGPV